MAIYNDNGNKIYLKADGTIVVDGDQIELGTSSLKKLVNEEFKDMFNNHVHNYIDIPPSATPVIGMTSTPANAVGLGAPPVASLPAVPPTGAFPVEMGDGEMTSKTKAE
ncbi:MAG: hypothetical protein GY869_14945 [Planctomycetes bacterium]|nr:hypothetical protein [Planctomycetota bacterium]